MRDTVNKHYERVDAMSTRFSGIASTIRATLYKQGERNLIKNILDGNGYEGVIEYWEYRYKPKDLSG